MNLELAKSYAWYGGVIAAIIGLIWVIWQMTQKEENTAAEQHVDYRRVLEILWGIALIPTAVILILISISQEGSGIKGILASILAGIVIPILLFSMDIYMVKRTRNVKPQSFTTFISLPLAGLGLSLLFIGFVVFFFGIRAYNIWISFIIGSALSLFVLRILSTMMLSSVYENSSGKMESIFFIVQAFLVSIIMAGHHFPATSTNAYFPLLLLMVVFISLLVSTIPFFLKPGKSTMSILPSHLAVFLGIFIGLSLFLVLRMNLEDKYLYPIITGSMTSCILIILTYGSVSATKKVDLSTGVMGTLLLLGGLWLSFRWTMGFGMTLFGAGLISIASVLIPYKSFEMSGNSDRVLTSSTRDLLMEGVEGDEETAENRQDVPPPGEEHTWANLFLRGITLAGLVVIITGLFRVLVQRSFMLTLGLDIAYADNLLALFLGVITPLCFEGLNLTGRNIFLPQTKGNLKHAAGLIIFSLVISVSLLYTIGIIFRLEGLGAFVLGLVISSLFGVYTFFAQRKEKGLFRAAFSPLWIALAAYSINLIKYADVPEQLTRIAKQQIMVGMLLLVIIVYFWTYYKNCRIINEETAGETVRE
jgi:hypothetical protein